MSIGSLELTFILIAIFALPVLAVTVLFLLIRSTRQRDQERMRNMKKCPFCAEFIKKEALVCRYCGRDQPQET